MESADPHHCPDRATGNGYSILIVSSHPHRKPKTMSIEAGTTYTHEFSFTQDEVVQFANVTGDKNPVHLDAAYAAGTMFKKPIMHGFLGGSVFSKVFGTLFPGEGTIYMKQSMAFMRPMFVNTIYEVRMNVKEVNKEKHRANVETIIVDKATGDIVINGEATVMNVNRI